MNELLSIYAMTFKYRWITFTQYMHPIRIYMFYYLSVGNVKMYTGVIIYI